MTDRDITFPPRRVPSRGDGTAEDVLAFIRAIGENIEWAAQRHHRALELLADATPPPRDK
jgi:hypothetical protein